MTGAEPLGGTFPGMSPARTGMEDGVTHPKTLELPVSWAIAENTEIHVFGKYNKINTLPNARNLTLA